MILSIKNKCLFVTVFYINICVCDIAEYNIDTKTVRVSGWLRTARGLQLKAFAAWHLGSRSYLLRRNHWTIPWSWTTRVDNSMCGTAGL